ncbi:putative hydrolase of the HAD superfamily [Actinoplanes octamycinicus]|uniref:Putative hydrolase of the HAD superfamily n=1 Tax=Actinoplanes octamycinicus TaxID=135948 RepID=A0A7W7GVV2_9ACTN|nr:HAD family hydrolase [Actinoplanes octamycinicus]MBB4739223.1 putative hydrolase of the HAD superfamily [Actinoplanes octamycinicus]GIE58801.1 hypothetical protein Aoc01nite_42030 [Actinoplanes octamycinicus]
MLLLLDLDNTLIDRDAAFRDAARGFLTAHRLPAADLGWLMATDASGYRPRAKVAAALAGRYPGVVSPEDVWSFLDNGAADRVRLTEDTRLALDEAGAAGWTRVIVTNGRVGQQTKKIHTCGLDRLVDGWVISEAVGHKKPAPEIFHAAAAVAGRQLSAAWMIGDSAPADVGGAHALGLPTVWISAGREWAEPAYRPTHIAADVAAGIRHALSGRTDARV